MKIYYRISDNSYLKHKLPGTCKESCLANFRKVAGDDFTIVADTCHLVTIDALQKNHKDVVVTSEGNAGSFWKCLEFFLESGEERAYFVEDDYLHLPGAIKVLEEGLEIADYATVYDHPDKYSEEYGFGETSKVMRTKSSHWRFTQSTTMTFAANKKSLEDDISIWMQFLSGKHPHDHLAFSALNEKGRKLAVSIPGLACHTDLTWGDERGRFAMEDWAMRIAAGQ